MVNIRYFFIALFLTCSINSFSQPKDEEVTRVLFILDASYSMNRKWDNEMMWDIAKRTLAEFATTLDKKHHVALALRVYGHNFDVSYNNCTDTKLEVPLDTNNSSIIKQVLSTLKYNGTTPIAYSLSFAREDFKDLKGKNNIILITDGEESCGGNPCKISRILQENGICLKPIVIGLNISEFGIENLKCIGEVSNSKTAKELKNNLDNALDKVLDKTTFQINLLNSATLPKETDVPITINSLSGTFKKTVYHTINSKGFPDTMYFNDLLEFQLKIHTIPPINKSINIKRFEHNTITIPAAQGILKFNIETKIPPQFEVLIRNDQKTIHVTTSNKETKLLVGLYDLDILSIPRLSFKNVMIKGEQKEVIQIPNPGILNISKEKTVIGGIYLIEQKKLKKIYSIQPNTLPENIQILPGNYTIVYRNLNALSIYDTKEKVVTIKGGDKVLVTL